MPLTPHTCIYWGETPNSLFSALFNQDTEEAQWKDMQLPANADSVTLKDLSYGSNYQLEVTAVNSNGSSIPTKFSFSIADQPGT